MLISTTGFSISNVSESITLFYIVFRISEGGDTLLPFSFALMPCWSLADDLRVGFGCGCSYCCGDSFGMKGDFVFFSSRTAFWASRAWRKNDVEF